MKDLERFSGKNGRNMVQNAAQKPQAAAPTQVLPQAQFLTIGEEDAGQRIDNYLLRICKGVPKSHIYRILRSGEVRVNKGRIDQLYRLVQGDVVRVPPVRVTEKAESNVPAAEFAIIFEDAHLLVIDKPAGTAVHGGSGVSFGVIEQLRASRPDAKFLELVHRLALPVLAPAWSIALSLLAIGAAGAVNFYLYRAHDLVFNVSSMLVLALALFILNVAWGYFFEVRRGRALVSRFGEYVAPELVAEMAENPEKYNMDGECRELSVMFVDVRGFTTISEGLTPKALREYINLYLTAMSTDIRDSHRGTLDKYIGDAVMAFWGAPVAFPDHASRAVATALLMQASAQRLNQDFLKRGWPELKIGIGVNTGQMHVGDMGSQIRRAYTVMGERGHYP
eukprot:gene26885-30396_t